MMPNLSAAYAESLVICGRFGGMKLDSWQHDVDRVVIGLETNTKALMAIVR